MRLLCAYLLILVIVSVCHEFALGRPQNTQHLGRHLQQRRMNLQVEEEGRSCHGRYCQKFKPDPVAPEINANRFNAANIEIQDTAKRCHGSYCQ